VEASDALEPVAIAVRLTIAAHLFVPRVPTARTQCLLLVPRVPTARSAADLLHRLTGAERVLEYIRLPAEETPIALTKDSAAWPAKGRLVLKDVSLKYAPDLPPVLKGVSIQVEHGEHVGIVGRTGAGGTVRADHTCDTCQSLLSTRVHAHARTYLHLISLTHLTLLTLLTHFHTLDTF
jgi:ABC-type siderophore export system fused ATPase/permease subunit